MKKLNILITGNAGLIGSRLANYIIENYGHNIIGIDNLSGGYVENINRHVTHYEDDCTSDISYIFEKHKPDFVYHMAAYAAEGLSPFIRMHNYKSNLITTANIINNCVNYDVKRLVFTSSMSVYGHGKNAIFDESLTPCPIDPYAIAKYASEMDIMVAGEQHGLDWTIIRPHNVYGIGQNIWDKYRNVIGIWMYQRLNQIPMTIFGDGTQRRAFSFIDDSLHSFWLASQEKMASKQIINLGGINDYSILEVNKKLRNLIGGDVLFLEKRHEVHTAVPTHRKSIEILQYKQTTSIDDGLLRMWEWAKSVKNRDRFKWDKYEIEKQIYSYWRN